VHLHARTNTDETARSDSPGRPQQPVATPSQSMGWAQRISAGLSLLRLVATPPMPRTGSPCPAGSGGSTHSTQRTSKPSTSSPRRQDQPGQSPRLGRPGQHPQPGTQRRR